MRELQNVKDNFSAKMKLAGLVPPSAWSIIREDKQTLKVTFDLNTYEQSI